MDTVRRRAAAYNLARTMSAIAAIAAAALSVLLLILTIAAWAWSYRTPRVISYRHGERREAVMFFGGRIGVAHAEFPVDARGWLVHAAQNGGPTSPVAGMMSDASVASGGWKGVGRWGFAWDQVAFKPAAYAIDVTDSSRIWVEKPATTRFVVMPLWLIMIAALPLPAIFVIRRVRRRRRAVAGACLVCGYDLRATPERCPECGADVRAAPAEDEAIADAERWAAGDRWRRLRRIAIAGIAVELLLLAVLLMAKLAHFGEKAIARFDFEHGTNDDAGQLASAELKYAPTHDGMLMLNGVYENNGGGGGGGRGTGGILNGYRAVFRVPQLDYRAFTVSWRFRLDSTDREWPYPRERTIWHRQNLITGGTSYRWLVISRNSSKHLNIAFNNDNVGLNFPDVELPEGRWMRLACSFDLRDRRRVLVTLDGRKVADLALPQSFSLKVIGSKSDATDRLFTFTNYSNGTTFGGEIDDLIVFPRALTEEELSRLAR
jgi:hypothetical protein